LQELSKILFDFVFRKKEHENKLNDCLQEYGGTQGKLFEKSFPCPSKTSKGIWLCHKKRLIFATR